MEVLRCFQKYERFFKMTRNKIRGVIFGQAIGDALGLGAEFMSKADVHRNYPNGLTDYSQIISDWHRNRWQRGEWTDDTDMMLCILQSYIRKRCVDYKDIAELFYEWAHGTPRGIGRTTLNVLSFSDYTDEPQKAAELVWNLSGKRQASNGGIMRTSIVGCLKEKVTVHAENICRLTHYDPRCVGSCVIISEIVHALVYSSESLSYEDIVDIADDYDCEIRKYVDMAYHDDLDSLHLDEQGKIGYTLKTLGSALWAYWHAMTFEDGLLQVVNQGGDADTNAAVAGAVLGAKFGCDSIPTHLLNGLRRESVLSNHIDHFLVALKL